MASLRRFKAAARVTGSAGVSLRRTRASHAEWSEGKQRDEDDRRYEDQLASDLATKKKRAKKEQAAREYDNWLKSKDNYERAVQLLSQISSDRCKDDEKWFEVAVCLGAIDVARGVHKRPEYAPYPVDRAQEHNCSPEEMRKRSTLDSQWYRWSRQPRDGHEFNDVEIPLDQAKTFTAAAQNMMNEYAEDAKRKKGAPARSQKRQRAARAANTSRSKRRARIPSAERAAQKEAMSKRCFLSFKR